MDNVVAELSGFATSAISDALDRLGIPGQAEGVYPLERHFRLAGRAFTVLYQPIDVTGGTVGDYIDDVTPGDVVVLDNSGRLDTTVWGDILTQVAKRRQVGGTAINGICRDSDRALELEYPLFSKARWTRTGKDRVKVAGVGVPVTLGGVRVRPGDVLIGDGDGSSSSRPNARRRSFVPLPRSGRPRRPSAPRSPGAPACGRHGSGSAISHCKPGARSSPSRGARRTA